MCVSIQRPVICKFEHVVRPRCWYCKRFQQFLSTDKLINGKNIIYNKYYLNIIKKFHVARVSGAENSE